MVSGSKIWLGGFWTCPSLLTLKKKSYKNSIYKILNSYKLHNPYLQDTQHQMNLVNESEKYEHYALFTLTDL